MDMLPLPHMATLAERVEHALRARGMKAIDLDRALAKRFGKKGISSGYAHRITKRNMQPGADVLAGIAEILHLADTWLLSGQGPMDRDEIGSPPTYDSLPGWAEAAEAETAKGRTHGYAIRAAGRSPAFVRPAEVSSDFVLAVALFWLTYAPESERQAAMVIEVERLKLAEDERMKR